jgi:hypothetical protein
LFEPNGVGDQLTGSHEALGVHAVTEIAHGTDFSLVWRLKIAAGVAPPIEKRLSILSFGRSNYKS